MKEKMNWNVIGPKIEAKLKDNPNISLTQIMREMKLGNLSGFYYWRKAQAKRLGKENAKVAKPMKRQYTKSKIKLTELTQQKPTHGPMFLTWGTASQLREFLTNYENHPTI